MTSQAEILAFYAAPAPMSDPGAMTEAVAALPDDIEVLAKAAQGLLLHEHWAGAYGVTLSDARRSETHIRPIEQILTRAAERDERPLDQARPLDGRIIGTCRDFTLLMTAALRARGRPARARCGFGAYFEPGKYVDHWVAECWNGDRWVMVDAQIDDLQASRIHPDFNTLDTPRDRFLVAGDAWRLARSGGADANAFGIMDMAGLWFIAGNIVRDAAALRKVEMLPWDVWGPMAGPGETLDAAALARFDHLAELTADPDANFDALREAYERDLAVPATVFNAVRGQPEPV